MAWKHCILAVMMVLAIMVASVAAQSQAHPLGAYVVRGRKDSKATELSCPFGSRSGVAITPGPRLFFARSTDPDDGALRCAPLFADPPPHAPDTHTHNINPPPTSLRNYSKGLL